MADARIDLKQLKSAIDVIFEHLLEDLKLETVSIAEKENLYWDCPAPELYDMSKDPVGLTIGSLNDDIHFLRLVQRGQSADASVNLVHVAPLLRFIAHSIGQ